MRIHTHIAEQQTMSERYPLIAITGSSGAGTSCVTRTFEHIFRREKIRATIVEGDAFHRYNRAEMAEQRRRCKAAQAGSSHFSPAGNLLPELEELFRTWATAGRGRIRHYLHDDATAQLHGGEPGTFTEWQDLPPDTELLFYEGLHGGIKTDTVDIAAWPDLLVGVVPVINLEWIQKIWRDRKERGYSAEAVTDTILRRMPDYVNYICPQFARTHINFQRIPCVDTSNPFIARDIPTQEESLVVIRFANPRGIDFPYLLNMISDSFMSRANTIVVPGGKMALAMQLIFTPIVWNLMERRRKALKAG